MGDVSGWVNSINQYLSPGIDLTKPISGDLSSGSLTGDATEVRLVDDYNLGFSSLPGLQFSIMTTFESDPVVSAFSQIAILNPGLIPNLLSAGAFVASEFYIQDLNGNGANYLSVIPEPSALSLLAVGLGGLAMMRRRRP